MKAFRCPKCAINHHNIGARIMVESNYPVIGLSDDNRVVLDWHNTHDKDNASIITFICHNCNHTWTLDRHKAVTTEADDLPMTATEHHQYGQYRRGARLALPWDET